MTTQPNNTPSTRPGGQVATPNRLLVPNDRDQIPLMTNQDQKTSDNADPMIAQAIEDVQNPEKPLRDTSRAVETDRTYAKMRN